MDHDHSVPDLRRRPVDLVAPDTLLFVLCGILVPGIVLYNRIGKCFFQRYGAAGAGISADRNVDGANHVVGNDDA